MNNLDRLERAITKKKIDDSDERSSIGNMFKDSIF